MLAIVIFALFVLGIAIYGLANVGPREPAERGLLLLGLAALVVAPICALRGLALREEAIAELHEDGTRGNPDVRPSTRRDAWVSFST